MNVIYVQSCQCPRCNHRHLVKVDYETLDKTLDKAIEELERETKQIWEFYERHPEAWLKEDPLS